jgi:hypothetical protein
MDVSLFVHGFKTFQSLLESLHDHFEWEWPIALTFAEVTEGFAEQLHD